MSEAENPELLKAGHAVSAAEIRALAGPATPHFAQQIAARIRRLIEPLDPGDPVHREGERQLERLADLARHTGEPRGRGPKAAPHG
jgi:hypothetical protein